MADNGMKGKDDGDDKKGGILNMSARVFVANVPADKISQKDLQDRFSKYGRVNDVYMGKTFAFVQFANPNDADAAIKSETGTFIGDNRIDCSLAKKQPRSQRPGEKADPGPYSRGGPSPYGSLPPRGRDRSPLRGYDDRFDPRRYDDLDRYPPPRDYRDDPFRRDDPYFRDLAERDALFLRRERELLERDLRERELRERDLRDRDARDRDARDIRDIRERELRERDYLDRRPPPVSSHFSDVADSGEKGPTDVEIIIASRAQKVYAEMVERRIRGLSMTVDFMFLGAEVTLTSALDSASRRGVLYAVVVTNQHELHHSITLNILYGTPQEHRNMPLDDALAFIGRNFDRYIQDMRERRERGSISGARPARRSISPSHIPAPPSSVELTLPQLLNLLADGRQLTLPEIDRVIDFLQDMRDRLAKEAGIPPTTPKHDPPVEAKPTQVSDSALQAKILSIFSGGVMTSSAVTPPLATVAAANQAANILGRPPIPTGAGVANPTAAAAAAAVAAAALQQQQARMVRPPANIMPPAAQVSAAGAAVPKVNPQVVSQVASPMQQQTSPNQAKVSSSLNLDNPNIQKALDDLIQNGPNLLKNLSSVQNLQGVNLAALSHATAMTRAAQPMARAPTPAAPSSRPPAQAASKPPPPSSPYMQGAGGGGSTAAQLQEIEQQQLQVQQKQQQLLQLQQQQKQRLEMHQKQHPHLQQQQQQHVPHGQQQQHLQQQQLVQQQQQRAHQQHQQKHSQQQQPHPQQQQQRPQQQQQHVQLHQQQHLQHAQQQQQHAQQQQQHAQQQQQQQQHAQQQQQQYGQQQQPRARAPGWPGHQMTGNYY